MFLGLFTCYLFTCYLFTYYLSYPCLRFNLFIFLYVFIDIRRVTSCVLLLLLLLPTVECLILISSDNGWHYLEFRFWIGMWMCLFLLIMVAFDLSALVRFITRFTEESFAMLIAIIFIYEAFKKQFEGLDHYPVNFHPELPVDRNCSCYPAPFEKDTNATLLELFDQTKLQGIFAYD